MEILRLALLFLHLIGFAALFGGLFVQLRAQARAITPAVLHGTLTVLITGLLLVGVLEGMDAAVDNAKIGAKSLVALVITVLVIANRKKDSVPGGLFFGLLALAVLNVGLAVFWAPVHVVAS